MASTRFYNKGVCGGFFFCTSTIQRSVCTPMSSGSSLYNPANRIGCTERLVCGCNENRPLESTACLLKNLFFATAFTKVPFVYYVLLPDQVIH